MIQPRKPGGSHPTTRAIEKVISVVSSPGISARSAVTMPPMIGRQVQNPATSVLSIQYWCVPEVSNPGSSAARSHG